MVYAPGNSCAECENEKKAPNDTAHTQCSCHSGLANRCANCPDLPFFFASRPCELSGLMTLVLIKAGNVETNPGPTTARKHVWISNICHRQIHVRKQISIWCKMIELWVHLRCAGIRLSQYTYIWTCHLHK